VEYIYFPIYNNNVGNDWGGGVKFNGNYIPSGSTFSIQSIFAIQFSVYVTEYDSYNDYGSSTISFDHLNVGETQTKNVYVTVTENRGKYTGNTAKWCFTITIKRIS
jgi:hypothetical protein